MKIKKIEDVKVYVFCEVYDGYRGVRFFVNILICFY